MNNKRLGNAFEKFVVRKFSEDGFWVHFISPDERGAQPFDIIAVKSGNAVAIDCKTSAKRIFPFSRLENNQVLAFEKWLSCGNSMPMIAVEYKDKCLFVPYDILKDRGRIDLELFDG